MFHVASMKTTIINNKNSHIINNSNHIIIIIIIKNNHIFHWENNMLCLYSKSKIILAERLQKILYIINNNKTTIHKNHKQ